MRPHATREEIDHVCERIAEFGYKVHSIEGEERVVIGVVGVGDVTACLESLEATPGVESAVRISAPYKFVSKEFRKEHTAITRQRRGNRRRRIRRDGRPLFRGMRKADHGDGGGCGRGRRADAARRRLQTAHFALRFSGHGRGGAKLLRKAKEATGLGIITEVMSDRDVELVAEYADCMQVGARNMQNFALLKSLGGCGRPVLLKRGMSSTIKELLMSAEYIVAHGNPNVILCERGIRTFETATRNTCDISAVPVLNELTHLPVILDPSHATGKRSLIPALSRAGVAIGADGLIVEVHPCPEKAVSDGAQSLTLADFRQMMNELQAVYPAVEGSARAANCGGCVILDS